MTVFSEPAAAGRYDAARELPAETKALWREALKSAVPGQVNRVLDLGCGTGRLTAVLAEAFACPVIGVEPSEAMLSVAVAQRLTQVEWKAGGAEHIPLEDQAVDLVFMSQVFHHLVRPAEALREIRRVLTLAGYLVIRTSSRENNAQNGWLRCFPEAQEIEQKRGHSQRELEVFVCDQSFALVSRQTVLQRFASSPQEYYEKIGQRGLSSLIALSDDAFGEGLQRLQKWADSRPQDAPIDEPVDLFVFQKTGST